MGKKKGHLTQFDVTIPTSVVESLDFIVSELQKEEKGINRNSVISYLIQEHYSTEGYYDKDPRNKDAK